MEFAGLALVLETPRKIQQSCPTSQIEVPFVPRAPLFRV